MSDRGVLDTSVFIAAESGRPLKEDLLPQEAAVSVVTLAELQAGVLAARDTETRARRLATLDVLNDVEILPVDADVALIWARLRVSLAESGRRINVNDLWIAATAARHQTPGRDSGRRLPRRGRNVRSRSSTCLTRRHIKLARRADAASFAAVRALGCAR